MLLNTRSHAKRNPQRRLGPVGITYQEARQLLRAQTSGAAFDAVGTIGRQSLYLHPGEAESLCDEFALPTDSTWVRQAPGEVADDFFVRTLGTSHLTAIDASDYEGAALIHDMNRPVPATLNQSFDAVIDGGSLEHIFDPVTALSNLMRLARVGGRVLIATPANNLCGHGFYQFSPEMMFRVFTPDRGFRLHDVAIFEYDSPDVTQSPSRGAWKVTDPAAVRQRVGLMSRRAAMLWVDAEKVEHLEDPFAVVPQQSDYVDKWTEDPERPGAGRGAEMKARLRDVAPPSLLEAWRRYEMRRRFSTRNGTFYSRLP